MLTVKSMTIGEGKPKVCVPLIAENWQELEEKLSALKRDAPDMIEWRVDALMNAEDFSAMRDLDRAYRMIRGAFPDAVLLTTVRSKSQGGLHKVPGGEYINLVSLVMDARFADILDIEYGHEVLDTRVLIGRAHGKHIPVLMSYTKPRLRMTAESVIETLENMKYMKPDMLRLSIAVETAGDRAALIAGAAHMDTLSPDLPVCVSGIGKEAEPLSLLGNHLGAPIIFAAPPDEKKEGSLTAGEAKTMLDILY